MALNVLSNIEDGKEAVNDTYLAVWNSMPDNRPSVLSTYLGKITRRISIDIFRRKNSVERYASEYALSLDELKDCVSRELSPEQAFDAKQLDNAINTFIRSLPKDIRTIFIGRYYFFDSVKTISGYSGKNESNVKTILYRTRQKLKDYLEKEGFTL